MKKYFASTRKWWIKQRYQFYRPEYEKLQNRLLNYMLLSYICSFAAIAIFALLDKYLPVQIGYTWTQLVFILMLCSVVSMYSASGTLRWVDEHEKKLGKKR